MAIQKVIKGDAETKYVGNAAQKPDGTSINNFTAFSSGITAVGEIYAAIPKLRQGTDEHERIGDTIMPTSCTLHLDICAPNFAQNQAIDRMVHVFVLNAVAVKDLNNSSAIPITQLLDNGQGAHVGFDGTPYHSLMPVNKKAFQVIKHLKFRLVKGFGKTNGSSATDPAGTTDSCITPSASYKRVRIRVKLPKKLKYTTAGQNYPTNAAPFFVIGWTSNWQVDAASNVVDLQVMGRVDMRFKDV